MNTLKYKIKKMILTHKLLYELYFFITRKSINRDKIDKKIKNIAAYKISETKLPYLIVSLTTYSKRVYDLKYTLYSLITQSVLPEKIIVWLSNTEYDDMFSTLPDELRQFMPYNVEFKRCEDLKSYKKLIPALISYPDYTIVTADDDIYYERTWLEELWKYYKKEPNAVIAHLVDEISFTKEKEIKHYNAWKRAISNSDSPFLVFLGCGGVLYQKKFLYKDVADVTLFRKLAPLADDLWFFFMVILQGTKIALIKKPSKKLKYVDIYKEYGLNDIACLSAQNVGQNKNDEQFWKIMNYYQFDSKKLYAYLTNLYSV